MTSFQFLIVKKKYNLLIIEDAAHAFLGKYKNKYLGTIGDFGAFSFHESKNIVGAKEVISNGGRVEIVPLTDGYSTSSIIESQNR